MKTQNPISEGRALPAVPLAANAGSHNSIFRGKYLGDQVTDAQYAAITAGTFDDLFIGDYWTIGGVSYFIGAFDYYFNRGNPNVTVHHILLVPGTNLYTAQMNATDTTEGGYAGSAMRQSNLKQAKTIIQAAFSGHILNHAIYLTSAVTDGRPTSVTNAESEVDLMSEQMVYGGPIFMVMPNGSVACANYRTETSQLPLFSLDPSRVSVRAAYWLRDANSPSHFAMVSGYGNADRGLATAAYGVRPAFCIHG